VKPVVQAIVLAEHVYQDVSGKKIIAGTFQDIIFGRKPLVGVVQPEETKQQILPGATHGGSPIAYVSLTDVGENTTLLFQFVNLTKNTVMFVKQLTVDCKDRRAVVELVVPLPPWPIAEEGVYAFEVVCEGEILGSHRINARELKLAEAE
jgi:hypothetical protein